MQHTTLVDRESDAGGSGSYDRVAVESQWRDEWEAGNAFSTPPPNEKEAVCVFAGCAGTQLAAELGEVRGFAIADAYARYQRANGRAVLFSLGFDCPSESAEQEAVRGQLSQLGCSFDWSRSFLSEDPAYREWSQRLFLVLLEQGAIYRNGGAWFLRRGLHAEENDRNLAELPGWTEDVVAAQQDALGRVDGLELDAAVVGGGTLPVFTPHGDSIEKAEFVAIAPDHPEIEAFVAVPEVASAVDEAQRSDWWRQGDGWQRMPAVPTGLQASVPGVPALLPVVVSPVVASLGGAAVLGIPEEDEAAGAISAGLESRPTGAWKLTQAKAEPRPAVRYGVEDTPVSSSGGQGAQVPVIHCDDCKAVPAPLEQLPLSAEGGADVDCPHCGAPSRVDGDTIDPRLERMWMWLSICAPAEDRAASMLGQADLERWLPAQRVLGEADAGGALLDQRTIAKILHDSGQLPPLAREPFAGTSVYGSISTEGNGASDRSEIPSGLGELLDQAGADVVRLALLNAASPRRSFAWDAQPIHRAGRFLEQLWDYAEPRIGASDPGSLEIDTAMKWRRRLRKWCRVAADKTGSSIERLEMQRATHNAILLLTRIRDFESRVDAEDGGLGEKDRQAIAAALLVLLQLLAPFVPHIAEELWSRAGRETLIAETPWPDLS